MTDTHFEHIPASRQLSDESGESSPASPLELLIAGLEKFATDHLQEKGYREGDKIIYEPPVLVEFGGSEAERPQARSSFMVNLGVHDDPERVVSVEANTSTGKEMGTLPFGEGEAGHFRIMDNGVAVSDKAEPGKPGVDPELWAQEQLAALKECADDPLRRSFFRVEQRVDTDAAV